MALNRTPQKWLAALLTLAVAAAIGWAAWHSTHATDARAQASAIPQCSFPPQGPASAHVGMVWVPGGRFEMGDTHYPEEGPLRPTKVKGFWMDRTEVTNEEFAAFVQATGYVTSAERAWDPKLLPHAPAELRQPGAVVFVMPTKVTGLEDVRQWWRYVPGAQWRHPGGPDTDLDGRGRFPVVAVTYEDAKAYAAWKGRSLPTEAQWEWAARGGQAQAALDHEQPRNANTWQGIFPVLNSADDGFVGLAPAGCYAPNAYGLYDMIGNAWEITRDVYTEDHRTVPEDGSDNSPDPKIVRSGDTPRLVIKGGSFLCAPNYCVRYRSGSRQPQEGDLGTSHVGFRTMLMAPGP